MMDRVDARVIPLHGAYNFRDAGGLVTTSGAGVKRGLLYRSDALDRLTRADRVRLRGLELRTVCDLRMPNERRRRLDRLPADGRVRALHLPLFPAPGIDPTARERVWGLLSGQIRVTDVERILAESYRHILRTQAPMLGRVLSLLAERERLPLLVHCQAGKDRTGLCIALAQLLLGVSPQEVQRDFLLSNTLVARHQQRLLRALQWMTLFRIPREQLRVVLEARREHLEGALRWVDEHAGSLERYLVESAGLRPETLDRIRGNLLE